MQSYLEPVGQYFIGVSPVPFSPKSIKTTLNKIFPNAMLPGAPLTTLNGLAIYSIFARILYSTHLTQPHVTNVKKIFYQE